MTVEQTQWIGLGAIVALIKNGAIAADFKGSLATLNCHIWTNVLSDEQFPDRAADVVKQRHRDIVSCPSQQLHW